MRRVDANTHTHAAIDRMLPTRRLIWIKTNLAHVISYYEPRPAVQNDVDFYVERIKWCREHFGQPVLISEPFLDYDILRRGRMDTDNKWIFLEERFYFRDLNQAFEFKMRWL